MDNTLNVLNQLSDDFIRLYILYQEIELKLLGKNKGEKTDDLKIENDYFEDKEVLKKYEEIHEFRSKNKGRMPKKTFEINSLLAHL